MHARGALGEKGHESRESEGPVHGDRMVAEGDLSPLESLSFPSEMGPVKEATARASGRRDARSMYLPVRMLASRVGGKAGLGRGLRCR